MTAKVILNPYAGRWQALKRREETEVALQAAGVPFEMVITDRPGHGTELAAQAYNEGFSPIIVAGGDGSINEVINGIIAAAQTHDGEVLSPLGIIPLGTANDLVVNLGLPKDLHAAAKVIAAGNTRRMDLGNVNGRFFGNNSAIGLEPNITLIQQRITRLSGILRYLLATLIGIANNPQWIMHLEWDDGNYHGPITLVTVGNNPLTGGSFYMTPHADPFDGQLTFVYGSMPTRLQILRLLPKTMKPGSGSYVEHPDIHEINSTKLRIRAESPTPLHTDGEIQSEAIQDIEYTLSPERMPVLLE